MKKKLLGLMLCTAILGSMMIGCGSKPAQDSSAAPEKATEESADGELYVYLVSKGFQHQFWQAVKQGADEKSAELGA